MTTLPSSSTTSSTPKTLTLTTSSIFLHSYTTFSSSCPQPSPPLSITILSNHSPLPPLPSNIPTSKLIPKTRFIIDGFRYSGNHSVSYFLSHFHSDHYTGVNPNWSKGLIFCSEITSRLLIQSLKLSPHFIIPLPLYERVTIDGCEVTLVDANHCPGAVQFLFKVPGGDGGKDERYVHTGDFRFSNSMKLEPLLCEYIGADAVFLDTTYCNPKFVFPSQVESVNYIVETIQKIRGGFGNERVLFLIATYVVGKEKILLEISKTCACMVYVDARKMSNLRALGFSESDGFTEDASVTDVHVVGWNVLGETWPYFRPNFTKFKEIMVEKGYEKAVGIVPTGWMYEAKRDGFAVRSKDSLEIHLVPYSEHSSYEELREYVRFLRPKRVVPTVGMDVEKLDGKHAVAMQKHFTGLVDEMANKQEFLKGFRRKSRRTDVKGEDDANNSLKDTTKELNSVEKLSETSNETGLGLLSDNASSLQESGSRESDAPKNENTEEMILEIRDCLPVWVIREQMLELLSTSEGNIVKAVSDFYERETEFHEQVAACTKSVNIPEVNSKSCSALVPELASDRGSPHGSLTNTSNPAKGSNNVKSSVNTSTPGKRSNNVKSSVKSTIPPKKRGAGPEKMSNKRVKSKSTSESSGSKQFTITKFFSKLVPMNTSQVCEVGTANTMAEEHSKNGNNQFLNDSTEPHTEQLDNFLQVISCSLPRSNAASILEEAKGNLNVALDIYYSTLGGEHDDKGELSVGSRSVKTQCCANVSSPAIDQKASDETTSRSSLFLQGLSMDNSDATFVLLPLEKYSPSEHACWRSELPAPYLHLARTFDLVEGERGKIKATGMLCNMFRSLLALSPEDVLPAVYLCTNKIAPDHKNIELNIGGSMVSAAIEEACGTNKAAIREMYNNMGDLGDVALVCRQKQRLLAPHGSLTIHDVFSVLRKISSETGHGSTARKKNLITNLMRSCREKEIKFLVRTLVRNLRIGAMMRTVLPALAQAVLIHSSPEYLHEGSMGILKEKLQNISAVVIEAYNMLPDLDLLVPALLSKGIEFSSSTLAMIPGIPIKPMLARITNGTAQALKLFQGRAFTCEFKYDGQRAQIHRLEDGSLKVYSRNGDETTSRFPDLVNIIEESCKSAAVTFIVDAEVVAVDRNNSCKLMSFQELSSRERGSKNSLVSLNSIKVDICVFIFDVMFANGEELLGFPLRQRRKCLKDLFHDEKLGYFEYAKEITVEVEDACLNSQATLTRINSFLEDAFSSSCEGVMMKSLDVDAGYVASKRTDTWLKVKRDYLEGMNDSLDLVPIGAWHGNGRKAGWYSPFLMACYNPDTEEFQSVCRVMSGFSDSFYAEMKEFFSNEKILLKKPPYYQTAEVPDLWFSAELVWEIRGADFTVSPVHHAAIGLVHPSRGISIRFPRFVRSLSDRKAEDCSTAPDVAEMFQLQTRKMDVRVKH